MGLDYYSNFLNGVAQSPYDYYKDLNQATVDDCGKIQTELKLLRNNTLCHSQMNMMNMKRGLQMYQITTLQSQKI